MLNPELKRIFRETFYELDATDKPMTKSVILDQLQVHELSETPAGQHAITLWESHTAVYPSHIPVKSLLKAYAQLT